MMWAHRRRPGDDPVGVAGWLYADIFLALVVIGLSTAWFTSKSPEPVALPDPTTTTTSTTTTTTTVPEEEQSFQLSCDEFFLGPDIVRNDDASSDDIEAALSTELRRRGLSSKNAKPGLVLLFGGYSGGDDDVTDGLQRARRLADRLRDGVKSFEFVEMRSSGGRSVTVNGRSLPIGGNGGYGAVVYFIFVGKPQAADLDCTA